MITLLAIGILVFTVKLVHFALKAAWGITKGVQGCGRPGAIYHCRKRRGRSRGGVR